MRYRPEQRRRVLDSERAGETQDGFPLVGTVADALPLRADDRARRRRDAGRPLPAGVARPARRLHRAGPRRRERPARVHLATTPSSARSRAQHGVELRDLRKPPRRPQRPDRREPRRTARSRPDGRLRLRDREDDGRARARPRGAARGLRASSSRPARPGSRSPAGGSPSTPSSPTSSPAPPSSSCSRVLARGGEVLFVEGQGSLLHPGYSG